MCFKILRVVTHPIFLMSIVAVFSINTTAAFGQASGSGFVYVMTNNPAGNKVIQYSRAGDGSLTLASQALTGGLGGTGNGVGALDPLGSADSLVLSKNGVFVLAVNAGSDQLSALSAGSAGLGLLNTVSSNGSFPNSVALSGSLVYVLNAQGTPNISGFRLGASGLVPIANSTVNLPGGINAIPHDIRFSPDGARLLVSEEGTNQIDIFQLNNQGVPVSVNSEPSAGRGPFAMKFARDGALLSTETDSNSVSSYFLTSSDTLSVISAAVPDGQQATCWVSVKSGGKFAFVSNTGSGDLSAYAVSGNGHVNLEKAVAAMADGGNPIDSAISADNSFLYAADTSMGRILIYRVRGASLSFIGVVGGLPTTVQGIVAQ